MMKPIEAHGLQASRPERQATIGETGCGDSLRSLDSATATGGEETGSDASSSPAYVLLIHPCNRAGAGRLTWLAASGR